MSFSTLPPARPKRIIWSSLFAAAIGTTTCCYAIGLNNEYSCPLLTMVPFSDKRRPPRNLPATYGYGAWTPHSIGISGYTHMAAALLAMDHFNHRDTSVVPELSELTSDCNVTFPFHSSIFVDSAYDKMTSVTELIQATTTTTTTTTTTQKTQGLLPCTIIGPGEPKAVEGTGIISASLDIPQMAYMDMEPRIGNKDEFPTLVRGIVEQHPLAEAVISYLQRPGRERGYVSVLHDERDNGVQFARALKDANETGLLLASEEFDSEHLESIWRAVKHINDMGYHTIVFVTDQPGDLNRVAEVAVELGLVGEEYFWVISGSAVPPDYLARMREGKDSPLDRLLRGAAIFRVLDGFTWNPEDKFLASWRKLGGSFVARLNEFHPLKNQKDRLEYFEGKDDFFQDERYPPSEFASFMYDSVIAVGIGACRSSVSGRNSDQGGGGDRRLVHETIQYFPDEFSDLKNRHVIEILKTRFQGASGGVRFNDNDGSRDAKGVMFGIYNIRVGETDPVTGMNSYEAILTSKNNKQLWEDIPGQPFLFYNGKPDQPTPLMEEIDANFLSPSVQTIGLFLMSLSLFISVFSAGWVWYMRKERSIQAAQPVFLYLICFGSIMMTLTNLTMSFDESYGLDETQLGFACNVRVWLFILGYIIMYAALFSKLSRINRIFQFRRRKVNIYQVLGPFAFLLICAIIVLTVWTVAYPMKWKRKIVTEIPLVTYGECEGSHTIAFVVPVVLLMLASTMLTGVMAWRTKDIQAEFSESSWIFYGIFTQIQAWVVGLPVIMILGPISPDAYYLGKALMFFIFSVSIVVLIIWPKMIRLLRKKFYGENHQSRRSRLMSSVGMGGSTVTVSGLSNASILRSTSVRNNDDGLDSRDSSFRSSGGSFHNNAVIAERTQDRPVAAPESSDATSTNGDRCVRPMTTTTTTTRQKSVRFSLGSKAALELCRSDAAAAAGHGITEDDDDDDEPWHENGSPEGEANKCSSAKALAEQKSKLLDDALEQVFEKEAMLRETEEELKIALEQISFLEGRLRQRQPHQQITFDFSNGKNAEEGFDGDDGDEDVENPPPV